MGRGAPRAPPTANTQYDVGDASSLRRPGDALNQTNVRSRSVRDLESKVTCLSGSSSVLGRSFSRFHDGRSWADWRRCGASAWWARRVALAGVHRHHTVVAVVLGLTVAECGHICLMKAVGKLIASAAPREERSGMAHRRADRPWSKVRTTILDVRRHPRAPAARCRRLAATFYASRRQRLRGGQRERPAFKAHPAAVATVLSVYRCPIAST